MTRAEYRTAARRWGKETIRRMRERWPSGPYTVHPRDVAAAARTAAHFAGKALDTPPTTTPAPRARQEPTR